VSFPKTTLLIWHRESRSRLTRTVPSDARVRLIVGRDPNDIERADHVGIERFRPFLSMLQMGVHPVKVAGDWRLTARQKSLESVCFCSCS
jgi:hypothetical protein